MTDKEREILIDGVEKVKRTADVIGNTCINMYNLTDNNETVEKIAKYKAATEVAIELCGDDYVEICDLHIRFLDLCITLIDADMENEKMKAEIDYLFELAKTSRKYIYDILNCDKELNKEEN